MSVVWEIYGLPAIISVLLHGALLAVMLIGWTAEPIPRQVQRPNFIEAQLVTLEAATEQQAEAKAEPRVIDLTQQRREQERQAEQQRQQQVQQRRQEEERRREEELRRQETERQRQKEAERKAEAERERQRQAEAERRQREQEAQQRARAEEEQQRLEESYAVAAQSYTAAISRRIEQNWSRPPSARNNMECELLIRLVPTGRVIQVDVIRSSGNVQFDRSAVQAVQRIEQFPEVREIPPEVFERYYRELTLVFRPQDLRQ